MSNKNEARTSVSPTDYEQLISNRKFMAGVVQARGLALNVDGKFKYINISSTNDSLLRAIQLRYGGGITNTTDIGRVLTISGHSAGQLLQSVSPYLLNY